MKVISYSLFGYSSDTEKNCFEFKTYLRGVMINFRMNSIIYPEWRMFLIIGEETYNSIYKKYFDYMVMNFGMIIKVMPEDSPLCTKMLWRLLPLYEDKVEKLLCRDLDSIATYREAQAVKQWESEEKILHCITDSISHNIPMLGGMIGFDVRLFILKSDFRSWAHIFNLSKKYNMNKKGSDQTLINEHIYPKLNYSATEHFVKGIKHDKPEINGRHYDINENIELDINPELKKSNETCGHIGSAGYYEIELFKFLRDFDTMKDEYKEIESEFSDVFYWANR